MQRYVWLSITLLILFANQVFPQSLDLTIKNYGISFGNSDYVNGIRLNFRDHGRVRVNGLNLTMWLPHEHIRGGVTGLAIGVPATGAENITGLATGLLGVSAERTLRGIALGPLGAGAGENIYGVIVAGLGAGAGESITGIGISGIGLGSGKNLYGLMFGGLAVGSGENAGGILIGGIGVGSGGRLDGLSVGGIAVGSGDGISGISAAGIAVGAGGDMSGLFAAGVGIGCGGTLKGISLAGLGIGAPEINGLTVSAAAGAEYFTGIALAPGYFRITEDGAFKGLAVSAFSHIQGEHRGVTIGLVNFARELHGLQVGVINIAQNNPGIFKILPLFNANFD